MPVMLLGIRLLLAAVFLAAGIGKLRDRRQFAATLTTLGVARNWTAPLATLIPGIEVLTGAGLLHYEIARHAATIGLLLLVLFTAVAMVSIWQGRTLECACFGSSASEPVGVSTVARNAGLIALSLLLNVHGPGAAMTSVGTTWSMLGAEAQMLVAVSLLLLIALTLSTVQASRLHTAHARLASRVRLLEQRQPARDGQFDGGDAGLPAGSIAPPFDLPRLEGDRASLSSLLAGGKSVALIFLSAHCPACHELWSDIERWQSSGLSPVTVAAVCGGSPQTFELKLMGHTVSNVLLEGDAKVAAAYGISITPSAVIVGSDGTVAGASATGAAAIRALLSTQA
jgi:uncharacterized membrane protein YphA (DoxX/SURF4 family)